MESLKPKHWLFSLPDIDDTTFVLYAPLHKLAVRMKSSAKDAFEEIIDSGSTKKYNNHPLVDFLIKQELLDLPKGERWDQGIIFEKGIFKNIGTLSLTNRCNLRCIYCYAKTGHDFETLSWEVAKLSIDEIAQHTLAINKDNFLISFHGGGEAFVELKLLQQCVEYAITRGESHDLRIGFSAVTNATLITPVIANWLKDNSFKHISVSLDGIQEVQDHQRPLSSGIGSFADVLKGVKNLADAGLDFSIRSTVTNYGVGKMEDFVRFAAIEFFPDGGVIHFEPVHLCGRAEGSMVGVDPNAYHENYKLAKSTGLEYGIDVICTLDRFKKEKKQYCSASNASMFCVSPNGKISGCTRVTKDTDSGADLYFYGEYNIMTKTLEIDEAKREKIFHQGKLPIECENCFARWTCQGNCPISRYTDQQQHYEFCELTKAMLLDSILEEVHLEK